VAQPLEARPETVETQPGLLAHHYTEADLAAPAVGYWQRAGERSNERSADVEAVSHLTQGLEVLQTLPDTSERAQHELLLQTTLGPAVVGQVEAALGVLAEALALVDHTGERYWEAGVYRLKGELLLQRPVPDTSQAEACFRGPTPAG
jgi:predicted ATPase